MVRLVQKKSGFALALLALASLAFPASADVRVRFVRGQPTFVSSTSSNAVEIAIPPNSKEKRTAIGVVVFNSGAKPANLGYENVSVQSLAGDNVTLLSYDALQHEAKVKAGWALFFTALASGLNSYGSAQAGYGSIGPYRYYSPVAAQIGLDRAAAQNQQMLNSVSAALDAALSRLDGSVLRTTTIDPGASFGGAVVFDLPKGVKVADLIVTVTFDGVVHKIPLDANSPTLQQASATDLLNPQAGVVVAAPPLVASPTPTTSAQAPIIDQTVQPVLITAATVVANQIISPEPVTATAVVSQNVISQQATPAALAAAPSSKPVAPAARTSAPIRVIIQKPGLSCIRVPTDPSQSTC